VQNQIKDDKISGYDILVEKPNVLTDKFSLPFTNLVVIDKENKLNPSSLLTKLTFGENIILSQTTVCQNSPLYIKNNSSEPIYIKSEGKISLVEPSKFTEIIFKGIGNQQIILLDSKSELKDETVIAVKDVVNPNLNFTELEYVNGLPTIVAVIENSNDFENYSLTYKNNKQTNEKLIMHPYKVSENKIEILSTDHNGCKTQNTQNFSVPYNYNLLAQNGLTAINNSFMPRALVDRNTAFTLEIVEIKTMNVVYKTSDALAPWTGMQSGKTYIWTVVLNNPEPGEPREYRGELSATGN
jgi:hypothetical protein